MSDYTQLTNFTAKDALISGNPLKIIRGTDFDPEFSAISIAVATKADLAGPTFTGTVLMANVTVSGTFIATVDGGTY
jgi:hypothetical protein